MNNSFTLRLYPRQNPLQQHQPLELSLQNLKKGATGLAQQILESEQSSHAAFEMLLERAKDLNKRAEKQAAMIRETQEHSEGISAIAKAIEDDDPATADAQSTQAVTVQSKVGELGLKLLLSSSPFYRVLALSAASGLALSIYTRYYR